MTNEDVFFGDDGRDINEYNCTIIELPLLVGSTSVMTTKPDRVYQKFFVKGLTKSENMVYSKSKENEVV